MKRKWLWLLISCMVGTALVLASCGPAEEAEEETGEEEQMEEEVGEEEEVAEEEEEVSSGEPQYGGIITKATASDFTNFDVMNYRGTQFDWWFEPLWRNDLSVDRVVWNFKIGYTPPQYMAGNLAESWESPDMTTLIVHLQEGVYWQDKAPVNGREFVADDVVQHYHRQLGIGSGYTEPSAVNASRLNTIQDVTAEDKYTVVFKFKQPSVLNTEQIMTMAGQNLIEAPEVVKLEGGTISNWKNSVGTGAWILADYVASSSATFIKNPNYWRYDDRYPGNQLPYIDTLKQLIIPDDSTRIAALRTGKVDMLDFVTLSQSTTLKQSNPELISTTQPAMGACFNMRCDHEPFTDINVRKALQLAIDRKTIAETYYKGTISGEPVGLVNQNLIGFAYDYDDWPQELKDEYSYNPEKARQLLADAGYPNGFKTNTILNVEGPGFMDPNLALICKDYFMDIGVDMEIRTMEHGARQALVSTGGHDQMCTDGIAFTFRPSSVIAMRWSENLSNNYTRNNDPGYDAIYQEYLDNTDPANVPAIMTEADKYTIEHHWSINLFDTDTYIFWQPYLKGYTGEYLQFVDWQVWSKCWIDQELKSSMGR